MELPEPGEQPWFLDWVLRSPAQAGKHLHCLYRSMYALQDHAGRIGTVREYFGGIGAQALMIEDMFEPYQHVVNEYSLDAVDHLKSLGLDVQHSDAYNLAAAGTADLACLDFGDLTAWKAQEEKPHGQLLSLVFALQPKAVLVTDIAARYLHLQKKKYEGILGFGTCDTYEDYLDAFSRQLESRYGYTLVEANYTRWSAVMAFVPEGKAPHGQAYKLPSAVRSGLVLS
jgi:hypothetical protein